MFASRAVRGFILGERFPPGCDSSWTYGKPPVRSFNSTVAMALSMRREAPSFGIVQMPKNSVYGTTRQNSKLFPVGTRFESHSVVHPENSSFRNRGAARRLAWAKGTGARKKADKTACAIFSFWELPSICRNELVKDAALGWGRVRFRKHWIAKHARFSHHRPR